ncbi:MAG: phosphatase PAP2 family protein [Bacteroidetes bacterium]|nr:phosphatase PAP2 family protein [Bacteroidota bacterium]
MPQNTTFITVKEEWAGAWQQPAFRRKVMAGMVVIVCILSLFPIFFQTIELRQGIVLNDPLLRLLPPHNVSLALFIIIWSITLLATFRAAQTPAMFVTFLWAYIFLCIFRTLTITLVPLDPPAGLIALKDPLSNFFYGDKFVTKDLFFSGHTSTIFLLYFTIPGKTDKKLALLATCCVGLLLLVHHVHYTLDVLGGLLFAWISWQLARKTIVKEFDGYLY